MSEQNYLTILRNFFRAKGITQTEMAKTLGIKQQYVSLLLTGRVGFSAAYAKRFEECFGVSSSWLLSGGGGSMLASGEPYNIVGDVTAAGDNSTAVGVGNVHGDDCRAMVEELRKEVARLNDMVERLVSSMDNEHLTLLRIVEALTVGKSKGAPDAD